jgi:hypothetical protein
MIDDPFGKRWQLGHANTKVDRLASAPSADGAVVGHTPSEARLAAHEGDAIRYSSPSKAEKRNDVIFHRVG